MPKGLLSCQRKLPFCAQANKTPLRPLDPTRLTIMNSGPDFTPSFANLGRPNLSNRGPPRGGPGGGPGSELPRGPVSENAGPT